MTRLPENYQQFVEDSLVLVAEAQDPPGLGIVDIRKLWLGSDVPESWLELVTTDLEKQGFGKDVASKGDSEFLINGEGLRAADKIRASRKPKSVKDRIATVPRSDWIALFAAIVSLIALFK